MNRIFLISFLFAFFSIGLFAQVEEESFASKSTFATQSKFKPRYAGTSIDAGFMFSPNVGGSAFYIAPKFSFQTTPRLFVNAGVGVIQYNLPPSQFKFEDSGNSYQRTNPVGAYVFVEGAYLLSERWTLNSSMMKNTTPEPFRNISPYRIPNEAVHFGVDFKVTPNISVGARIGYSN